MSMPERGGQGRRGRGRSEGGKTLVAAAGDVAERLWQKVVLGVCRLGGLRSVDLDLMARGQAQWHRHQRVMPADACAVCARE